MNMNCTNYTEKNNVCYGTVKRSDILQGNFDELSKKVVEIKLLSNRWLKLKFYCSTPPKSIDIGKTKIPVRCFYPLPKYCYKCLKFNHLVQHCKQELLTCSKCGKATDIDSKLSNAVGKIVLKYHDCSKPKCPNCKPGQNYHAPNSSSCSSLVREKKIVALMVENNISYVEARNTWIDQFSKWTKTQNNSNKVNKLSITPTEIFSINLDSVTEEKHDIEDTLHEEIFDQSENMNFNEMKEDLSNNQSRDDSNNSSSFDLQMMVKNDVVTTYEVQDDWNVVQKKSKKHQPDHQKIARDDTETPQQSDSLTLNKNQLEHVRNLKLGRKYSQKKISCEGILMKDLWPIIRRKLNESDRNYFDFLCKWESAIFSFRNNFINYNY